MRAERRPILYLIAGLAIVAAAMTLVVHAQRDAAARSADRKDSVTRLLGAMFDVDSASRAYVLSGDPRDLGPLAGRQVALRRVLFDLRQSMPRAHADELQRATDATARFNALVSARVREIGRRGTQSLDLENAQQRAAVMDEFRATIAELQREIDVSRETDLRNAGRWATFAIVVLVLLLGLAGYGLIRRGARLRETAIADELRFRESQREFTDVVQAVASENEAHAVLKRHLERLVDGGVVTVLTRNNSANRLEAATPVPSDGAVARGLRGAEPRDCVAVRLAQPHGDGAETKGLISCRICGSAPDRSECRPLLVGGQVIGSVLVQHQQPLHADEQRAFVESVNRAAPVLANLKAIAIAESRAATDALTGLANRRAMTDRLRQMAAHASRSVEPLAAIAMDLDRFKTINDRYGHETGDNVLAAVGEILRASTRDSDVPARLGGEEFMVLAPDTGAEGAEVLAEKLREAVARAVIPGLDDSITASFGVAVLPDDAHTPELLLRRADRALYIAKELGRNRVELVRSHPG